VLLYSELEKMHVPIWERCRLQSMFPNGNMDKYTSEYSSVI